MPALPRVPTVQLWHSEVPTLAKVILPDAVQRMDHDNPEVISSPVGLVSTNALVLAGLATFRLAIRKLNSIC